MDRLGIIQYGVGPMGIMLVRAAARRETFEFMGAIDVDPDLIGKDLGHVAGLGRFLNVPVSNDGRTTLDKLDAPIVLHSTGSILPRVLPQLEDALKAGKTVISTCEELIFPTYRYPELVARLNELAQQHGGVLIGTGINPGFAMDLLPLTLSSTVVDLGRIHVKRYQDASSRRLRFQEKIGAGLSLEEFRKRASDGAIRHVGLTESVALIAHRIGWSLSSITEEIEPVVASESVNTDHLDIPVGGVVGCRQVGRGLVNDQEVITLEMCMYLGADQEFDSIVIEGDQRIEMRIPGGIHGDGATVARVLNAIPVASQMSPGFYTIVDLPIVSGQASVVNGTTSPHLAT